GCYPLLPTHFPPSLRSNTRSRSTRLLACAPRSPSASARNRFRRPQVFPKNHPPLLPGPPRNLRARPSPLSTSLHQIDCPARRCLSSTRPTARSPDSISPAARSGSLDPPIPRPSAAAVSSLRLQPDLLIAEFLACSIPPDSLAQIALLVGLPLFPHSVRLPAVRLPDQRPLSALSSARHSSPP